MELWLNYMSLGIKLKYEETTSNSSFEPYYSPSSFCVLVEPFELDGTLRISN